MKKGQLLSRVLSLHPTSRGFAFVVLEGPNRIIDWGTTGVEGARIEVRAAFLMERYQPTLVTIENFAQNPHRGERGCGLLRRMQSFFIENSVPCRAVDPAIVGRVFPHRLNKYGRACRIAEWFSELTPRLPKARRPWTSEAHSMAIFDAVAIALAGLHERHGHLRDVSTICLLCRTGPQDDCG